MYRRYFKLITGILQLADVMILIRWREEPDSESTRLLDLTDEQRKEIVRTLRTLIVKLKTWGI